MDLPPHLRFDREYVERHLRSFVFARMIRSVLHDAERIPEGGCLLVGNHGPLAIDTGVLVSALFRERDRLVRPLGDRFMFANPLARRVARSVAGVVGSPENAHALLAHGDAVLVYPGGAREATRDSSQRYQLAWEGRLGFARVALDAQVPVVPVACIGSDDLLRQVVDQETVRRSFAGKWFSQFMKPDAIPPLYVPKLRATEFHYFFGTPIAPTGDGDVQAHQLRVKSALETLVAHGLELRQAREELQAQYRAI